MVQPFAVLHALSGLILVLALAMGVPLLVAEMLDDGARFAFEGGMLATAGVGVLMRLITQGKQRELRVRDGFLLVAGGWAGLPVLAALPLMLYLRELPFSRAWNGWTLSCARSRRCRSAECPRTTPASRIGTPRHWRP